MAQVFRTTIWLPITPIPESAHDVEVARENGARADGLEIVIGDATIRVGSEVAPALLVETIRAVRAA